MPVSKETLAILRSVRTSDVSDALDSMGCQQRYEMDAAMRPLYPGIRFPGIAHPQEYDVIDRPLAAMPYEEFDERQYKAGPDGLWREAGPSGAPDEVLVIDAKRTRAGILGSHNTLSGRIKGVVGYVIENPVADIGSRVLAMSAHDGLEAAFAVLFEFAVHRLGDPVAVQHQDVARREVEFLDAEVAAKTVPGIETEGEATWPQPLAARACAT